MGKEKQQRGNKTDCPDGPDFQNKTGSMQETYTTASDK